MEKSAIVILHFSVSVSAKTPMRSNKFLKLNDILIQNRQNKTITNYLYNIL